MKTYPSIPHAHGFDPSLSYHVFDKLDGSNIRAEWAPKRGFYKFGTRTQLLTSEQTALLPSIDAIQRQFGEELGRRLNDRRWERAVVFFEYAGPHSFAGSHTDPAEAMTASVIDVAPYKKGLLPPEQFLTLTEGLLRPQLLYRGRVEEELLEQVRAGTLPGMTFEGVVAKGPFSQRAGGPVQFKVKNRAWLERLKTWCKGDDALFARLS